MPVIVSVVGFHDFEMHNYGVQVVLLVQLLIQNVVLVLYNGTGTVY